MEEGGPLEGCAGGVAAQDEVVDDELGGDVGVEGAARGEKVKSEPQTGTGEEQRVCGGGERGVGT